MKNKISMIILTLVLLILLASTIFLGVNYINQNNDMENLQAQITELQQKEETEENKEPVVEDTPVVEPENNPETPVQEETKIDNVTSFSAENGTYLLQLVDYYGKDEIAKGLGASHFMIYKNWGNAIDYYFGTYYVNGNQLRLFLTNKHSDETMTTIWGTTAIPNSNGWQELVLPYDKENGTVTFGQITLTLEK